MFAGHQEGLEKRQQLFLMIGPHYTNGSESKYLLKSQQAKQDIGITKRFYGEEKEHKGTLLASSRLFLNIKSLIDKTHGIDGKAILKHLKLLLQYYISSEGQ